MVAVSSYRFGTYTRTNGPSTNPTRQLTRVINTAVGKTSTEHLTFSTTVTETSALLKEIYANELYTPINKSDAKLNNKGVWEDGGKPFLFLFWDHPNKKFPKYPAYLELCLESILCHNRKDFNIKILSSKAFVDSVGHVHPAFHYLTLNHKSDYFRGVILHHFGGVYFDADTMAGNSMKKLYEKLDEYDMVGATSKSHEILHMSNLGPMKANTSLTRNYIMNVHKLLDNVFQKLQAHHDKPTTVRYPLHWTQVGGGVILPIMKRLLEKKEIKYFSFDGPTTWLQFGQKWMSTKNVQKTLNQIKENPPELFHISSKITPRDFKLLNRTEIVNGDNVFAQLINFSFQQCGSNLNH